ncbi:MAG TPA: hypothetical protein VL527_06880 [Dongiaceae bacterium]|jgi:hypothetical protein|nr:hypothetical protein [Dongiaceae bacterium]
MNDGELNAKLQGVPVPERPAAYWEEFPGRVRRHIDRSAATPLADTESWLPRLAWASSVAFAALVVSLGAWGRNSQPVKTASQFLWEKPDRHFQAQLAQLKCHLNRLMRDEHGLHSLIAETEQN